MKIPVPFFPRRILNLTLQLLLLGALRGGSSAAPGDVDLSFDAGSGVDGTVRTVVVQPDGKVIIGGEFTTVKGLARANLARLNADGSGDSTFDPGALVAGYFGGSNGVGFIALQTDGKLLVLYRPGYAGAYAIVRLNSDGRRDSTFNMYGVGGDYTEVSALTVQPDGRVLVAGDTVTQTVDPEGYITYSYAYFVTRVYANGSHDTTFTNFGAGAASLAVQPDGKVLIGGNGIVRVNADGSPDTSFTAGANGSVGSIVVQSDGKILLGGWSLGQGANRNPIVRLNANGSLDSSFNPVAELDSVVAALVLQSDGRVIIGGSFTAINGTQRNGIARLQANGTLDSGFDPGPGANAIYSIALQTDGNVVIAGGFTKIGGINRDRIARLNANGGLDGSFHAGSGVDSVVNTLALQPDAKMIIGGDFSRVQDLDRSGIARLNVDGSLDDSFHPGAGIMGGYSVVNTVFVQPDGKVVVGGDFTNVAGTPRNQIARLNADGSLDASFNVSMTPDDPDNGYYPYVASIAVQPDGKVIIGGLFYEVNGTRADGVARLNVDGSLDGSFHPGTFSYVQSMLLQPDGRLVVGGTFLVDGGTPRNGVFRLNVDGSPDSDFNGGAESFGYVTSLALQSDGKLLIGGAFSAINGARRTAVARLNADGTLDHSFTPDIAIIFADYPLVKSLAVQSDGKVLIGGLFSTVNGSSRNGIARLQANGSLDSSLDPGTGISGGDYPRVNSVIVQPDGKVLIGGLFTSLNGVARPNVARLAGDSGAPPNRPPSANITLPSDGSSFAAPATIGITVEASDSDGVVARVDVYANSTLIGSDTSAPFEIVWNGVADGSYALTAIATDDLGANSISAAINITVTNIPPTVAITSPVAGLMFTTPATIAITVDAADGDGTIARVDVYVGETLIGSDTSAPFEAVWNNPSAGNYSITADAIDNLGATATSAAVDVIVATPLPAAPSGLIATAVSRNRLILIWTDNAPNELGFKIERSTNGKPFKAIAKVGANVTSFENTGLAPGTKYSYRVRAYNAVGNSGFSNKATATTSRRFMSWLPFDS